MHEMPIAMEIVNQSVAAAEAHGATRIEEIEVEIGRMRQVVPEALQLAFEACRAGTLAELSRLVMTEVPIAARCQPCGHEFEPDIDLFLCPACGEADVAIVRGNDMILKSLTCQTPEEASSS